jgi:hypothetical protein
MQHVQNAKVCITKLQNVTQSCHLKYLSICGCIILVKINIKETETRVLNWAHFAQAKVH